MADAIRAKVVGLRELQDSLLALPGAIADRALRSSVAAGAAVMRDAVQQEAPVYTGEQVAAGHPPAGTLKQAIYMTRLVADCTPTKEVWLVSARKGRKFQAVARGAKGAKQVLNLDAFYWTWVEFGHLVVPPGQKGLLRRARRQGIAAQQLGLTWIAPNPFMRRAYAAKATAARDAMIDKMRQRVADAVRRAKRT